MDQFSILGEVVTVDAAKRVENSWDFEVDAWSRFWKWNLIKIFARICDMTWTLGFAVPSAMFKVTFLNEEEKFSHQLFFLFSWGRIEINQGQRLTFQFRNFSVSKLLPNLWGFSFRKIWFRKKSLGFRLKKNLVLEKSLGFRKFGFGKKSLGFSSEKIWSRKKVSV